jgi:tetratricopeptide (TPR) repeat protein
MQPFFTGLSITVIISLLYTGVFVFYNNGRVMLFRQDRHDDNLWMKNAAMNIRKITLTAIPFLISLLYAFSLPAAQGETKKNEEDIFKKATTYFYQGKYEMAEVLFQEELTRNPENQLAYSYLGDISLRKKQYDAALEFYKRAIELNPKSAEDYFRIGQVYYYKKDADPAIENFTKSRELDPKIRFAVYHIGLTYLMLKRDKANTISNWEEFLRIAPDDPQYDRIRRVLELLKDPNFVIPPLGSEISIEEALHLGGMVLKESERKAEDTKADHEKKKTKNAAEDIYRDDGL